MPWLEYVESDLNVSDGPSRELENFPITEIASQLGITDMERAELPDFETFFASPASTLEHLFCKVRDLAG